MPSWIVGDMARCSVQITDPATNLAADPGAVVLRVKSPSGVITNNVYPGTITRTAAGAFQCDVPLTEKGRWSWRWETNTPYQGACQGDLTVVPSNI
jgi:hypothetical protein